MLVIFELDNAPCESPDDCYVEFVDKPSINGPVHPMTKDKIVKGEVEGFDDWTSKYKDFMPWHARTKQQTLDLLNAWV